ncbi:hemerythrin domain-containing protein [Pararhodobacter marinus]|uniref:hemerythrin domain-containing protein n=1 Tax=Pararhodobacter marinus TaxID=2184063 RepID=UPI003514F9F3
MSEFEDLEHRAALPDALRVLVADYPRESWQGHPNFDGLTRFWLERHLAFRQMLPMLQSRARAIVERDAEPDPRALIQIAGGLLNDLHGHHQIEDHHYFPMLARAEPRLKRGFDLLDADHHLLDAHIRGLADSTNAVLQAISRSEPPRETAARLDEALTPFETFLDRHLEDEEEIVVPVILHHALSL